MKRKILVQISAGAALLALLGCAGASRAQEAPAPVSAPPPVPQQPATVITPPPCVQPAPTVRLQYYTGPLKKTIALFTQQLERKAVHPPPGPPRYTPGLKLCSLPVKAKFMLFVRGSFDPIIFLTAGFNAGISQAENADAPFGQGAAGYGKRFGAAYADQATYRFFKDFAFPSIFREDPRYYRLSEASGKRRLLHAMEHVIVAHNDDGRYMFNYSEWLGSASAFSVSNLYHPGNRRGFDTGARVMGIIVGSDMGADVLREFWPEITHKLKLPFRAEPVPPSEEIDTKKPPAQ